LNPVPSDWVYVPGTNQSWVDPRDAKPGVTDYPNYDSDGNYVGPTPPSIQKMEQTVDTVATAVGTVLLSELLAAGLSAAAAEELIASGGAEEFLAAQRAAAADADAAGAAEPGLLNPSIDITDKGMQHVIDRHTINDIAKYADKSKFNTGEDLKELITSGTQQPMTRQANGNFARTWDTGRSIGVDRATGRQTSTMTVITKPDGSLVTAFPGNP
jgi:hypothetical protein